MKLFFYLFYLKHHKRYTAKINNWINNWIHCDGNLVKKRGRQFRISVKGVITFPLAQTLKAESALQYECNIRESDWGILFS